MRSNRSKELSSRDVKEESPVDRVVAKALGNTYGQLSRRAFLSKVTRKILSISGFVIGAEIIPFLASEAHADVWNRCGLHGWICGTGTCSGGTIGAKWIQCCPPPLCPNLFQCCTYTDYCGTRPPGWGTGCDGATPSGTLWCGQAPGLYICTEVSCSVTKHEGMTDCLDNCPGQIC